MWPWEWRWCINPNHTLLSISVFSHKSTSLIQDVPKSGYLSYNTTPFHTFVLRDNSYQMFTFMGCVLFENLQACTTVHHPFLTCPFSMFHLLPLSLNSLSTSTSYPSRSLASSSLSSQHTLSPCDPTSLSHILFISFLFLCQGEDMSIVTKENPNNRRNISKMTPWQTQL